MTDIEKAIGVFDSRTKHPVFPGEDGQYYCYGHVPVEEFMQDVILLEEDFSLHNFDDYDEFETLAYATSVIQGYAYPLGDYVEDDPDGVYFNFCDEGHEGAFPITRLQF